MTINNLNDILENSKSLNDVSLAIFGVKNYYNREKSKKILEENNINWKEWLESKKRKPNICKYCGKEIIGKDKYRKIFCNSSCAASFNNKNRKIVSTETKIKISETQRSKHI